jgi:Tfp pilus assembly protein PilN
MTMRRLELDYVAPPPAPRALGMAVLAIALATAGMLVERYREVRSELERIETAQRLLGRDQTAARPTPRARLDEEAKSVEAVLRQLALPWGAIIETVEGATTGDVAILQLQPDAQQRQLRLGAEARTRQAMLEYLKRLSSAKGLAEVHVVSHQVQTEDPNRPVQFTVQALLKDAP